MAQDVVENNNPTIKFTAESLGNDLGGKPKGGVIKVSVENLTNEQLAIVDDIYHRALSTRTGSSRAHEPVTDKDGNTKMEKGYYKGTLYSGDEATTLTKALQKAFSDAGQPTLESPKAIEQNIQNATADLIKIKGPSKA